MALFKSVGFSTWLFLLAGTLQADEKKIPLDQVPKAGLDAVKGKFAGADLTGAEMEAEDGKTIYEVALKYKGNSYEVELTPDGKIIGYDKIVAAKDMPKAVADTLESKYPGATYKEVEEVYKVTDGGDKLESYEIALVTADKKKYEVLVSPEGKITKVEDKNKEEKK
jgi:uncharacterized membrane protein YkoI